MTIRYRRATVTLYGKSNNYPRYRLAFYAAGKRHTKSFDCYASALAAARAKAKAIASAKSVAATAMPHSHTADQLVARVVGADSETKRQLSQHNSR